MVSKQRSLLQRMQMKMSPKVSPCLAHLHVTLVPHAVSMTGPSARSAAFFWVAHFMVPEFACLGHGRQQQMHSAARAYLLDVVGALLLALVVVSWAGVWWLV